MKREKVKSSNIKSIGYDEEKQILEIEFTSKIVYQFAKVSKRIYENLMNTDSKGTYFHKYIKNKYIYKRI